MKTDSGINLTRNKINLTTNRIKLTTNKTKPDDKRNLMKKRKMGC